MPASVTLPSALITTVSVSVKGPSTVPVVIPLTVITNIVFPFTTLVLSTVTEVSRNVPLAGCGPLAAQAGLGSRMASPPTVAKAAIILVICLHMI
jgi:hypothetical protein